jgi:putative ABC transport system permease protein
VSMHRLYLRWLHPNLGTARRGARNVARNPLRLALVVALLGTGLMFVVAMVALNASAQQRLQLVRDEIGTGIDINPAGRFGSLGTSNEVLSLAQVQAAEHMPGVVGAVEQITENYDRSDIKSTQQGFSTGVPGSGSGSSSTKFTIEPTIYGVTPGLSHYPLFSGGSAVVTSGRNLTSKDSDKALTSKEVADANAWHLGSTFAIDGNKVTLVGLVDGGSGFGNNLIIVPINTARTIYHISGATEVTVYAASDTIVPRVVRQLKRDLGSKFDVTSQATNYATTLSALQSAQNNIATTLLASIVTTALMIVFVVILIVRERIAEIGLLKAIGASDWQVLSQFGAEMLALSGLSAAMAGLLLAILGPVIASKFNITVSTSPFSTTALGGGTFAFRPNTAPPLPGATRVLSVGLSLETVALIMLVGVGLAVLASTIPAWYVARIKPAEVLRAE